MFDYKVVNSGLDNLYKSGPLNVIGQFSHDAWCWLKDSCKVCHQSPAGFDPSIVSQIGRFLVRVLLSRSVRSLFVGFVSVMD